MALSEDTEPIKQIIESSDTCMASTSSKSKRSRWGPPGNAAKLTGLQAAITTPMTSEQIEAYALHLRIEEITQRLRIDDVLPPDRDRRCPSPEPQYDDSGRRTNTRYRRHRERLENERHSLIQVAMRTIPNYRAPVGYVARSGRLYMIKEKVYIPSKDFPEVNFIGQLLGPRGRSLVEMNTQSSATISIRGKGSVKEGRGRGRGSRHANIATDHDQQEPLHCLITADTQEKIDKAKTLVQAVIETATTTPEYANERKRGQLRAVAIANGTFRDDEGHGYLNSPRATSVVCYSCSGTGHVACDCPSRKPGVPWRNPPWRRANHAQRSEDAVDVAYMQFISEMGGPL